MALRVRSTLPEALEQVVARTIDCAFRVHRELGPGFLERIYQKALCLELRAAGLAVEVEKAIDVRYREWLIPGQRLDMVVDGVVIVEVKAIRRIGRIHEAVMLSYLRSTGIRVGLILNFRGTLLRDGIRRVVV